MTCLTPSEVKTVGPKGLLDCLPVIASRGARGAAIRLDGDVDGRDDLEHVAEQLAGVLHHGRVGARRHALLQLLHDVFLRDVVVAHGQPASALAKELRAIQ